MKSVCFYFKIHQPFRLKRYSFFDIGNDHYYFDDFANDDIMTRLCETSYLPMADTILEMIKNTNGAFKCSICISGTAIEQMQLYCPEMIDKLTALAASGCVEFLSGTYSHSLASIEDPEEFMRDVKKHDDMIRDLFGKVPTTFANTELIYSDEIGDLIKSMGFDTCLTVGAKHILGWKSPNYIYNSEHIPELRLLLTNDKLADDIARNFNNPEWPAYPLTADKYMDWIAALPEQEQVVNLYFSMDTFGSFLPNYTGIFDFMKALPIFARERGVQFTTPSDIVAKLKPVGSLSVPYPMSDIDEARDTSAWKGNIMQNEALNKLYSIAERVNLCTDRMIKQDWEYLQSSDHFYYMSTKKLADGASHAAFSPYDSPFSAFTNYMNVLSDYMVRVAEQYPEGIDNEELNALLLTIRNQASEISSLQKEVKSLRSSLPLDVDEIEVVTEEVVPAEKNKKTTRAKKSEGEATPKKKVTRKKN